ncbi:MAG: hypothetical protein CMI53_04660 [Parcubacteria group bacterium]|nr:hypothetical protein [Parcubacteria group bacterium]|tara:strand:+ start:9080 stop:10327 length:1248 start_codon:yes stop_codon:yes gene_type:complete
MISESLKIAIDALKNNLSRTVLTVLGIVIGISSVITVIAVGQGIKQFVVKQVEGFGPDLIEVEIKVPSAGKTSSENAVGIATGIEITTLTINDQQAINKLPNIKNSYAGSIGQQIVSFEDKNKQVLLFGVTSEFINIDTANVETGRFFTDDEDRSLANVVVIGSKVKEEIFGDGDHLGKLVKMGNQKFRVIGALESRGTTFGFDMDDMIYVPTRTLQKKIMGVDHVSFMMVQVFDSTIVEETAEEITWLLRDRHDITDPDKDDFHATSMAEALEILDTVFWAISLLLIAVASVSLIVGGVGIMNIMYVSVMERVYEIGLRKAVGASRKEILNQFLWEAIIITFFGAVIGIIVGVILSLIITFAAKSQGLDLQLIISFSSIVLSCGVAVMIGLVFGILPARTAAKMDVIQALRYNK